MLFDPLYMLIVGIGLVLGFLASAKVKSTAAYYSRIGTRRGYTGAQVADAILRANGIHDVKIESVSGQLTDHYDPRNKTLRLSETVYGMNSITAVGVAAGGLDDVGGLCAQLGAFGEAEAPAEQRLGVGVPEQLHREVDGVVEVGRVVRHAAL